MNDDFKVYVLAELAYKKEHKEIDEDELFSLAWHSSKDYKLKTDIILEAIKNHKLITEVDDYYKVIEVIE